MTETVTRPSLVERSGIPRPLAWGFLGVLIFMIGDGVEAGYLSPYLVAQGLSTQQVALLFTVYGVTAGIAAWLSGALSDLWGPRRVMALGLVVWVVFQVLFLVVAVPTMNFPLLLLGYGLRGFGYPLFAFGFLVWVAAATPRERLGTAVGWFWFAFTGGLPTLGSLVASGLIPVIGPLATLWVALALIVLGGLIALLLVRERTGFHRLAPAGERPLATLLGSVSILWRNPRIGVGCLVRVINTAPQFGFLVFLPLFFTETIGFTLGQWLRLLTVMFATNIVFNLIFGIVGDRLGWRRTVAWCGGVGSALTILLLYHVPVAAGPQYWLALLVAAAYGATLAGYVPLSALMPSLAPEHKGQAMAALNLGAGASVMAGPAIAGLFLGPFGVQGVMVIFAVLYLVSAGLTLFLKLPDE
ncbi:MFS transporter [Allokutzneria sp. A3M-2-11 16]|uniref:MFS transporter n=1 Tax=Allokutzneria sp. A3M-2-11 16 TaxID=2962043 RepID=UPI0020B797D2|nr:MFS transporter [Allokutzneria sp. A3M-2-11 16]MCP3802277.1 MFS transporter [Allokutzneria sp. A3M-2-11 16]